MINNNKKLHSLKVTYYYEFDWEVPSQTTYFKTIEEFEKWEMRNPQCAIEKVKARYYKKGR